MGARKGHRHDDFVLTRVITEIFYLFIYLFIPFENLT